jgi:hypothetical protein
MNMPGPRIDYDTMAEFVRNVRAGAHEQYVGTATKYVRYGADYTPTGMGGFCWYRVPHGYVAVAAQEVLRHEQRWQWAYACESLYEAAQGLWCKNPLYRRWNAFRRRQVSVLGRGARWNSDDLREAVPTRQRQACYSPYDDGRNVGLGRRAVSRFRPKPSPFKPNRTRP